MRGDLRRLEIIFNTFEQMFKKIFHRGSNERMNEIGLTIEKILINKKSDKMPVFGVFLQPR